jgi:hypothetical protein
MSDRMTNHGQSTVMAFHDTSEQRNQLFLQHDSVLEADDRGIT